MKSDSNFTTIILSIILILLLSVAFIMVRTIILDKKAEDLLEYSAVSITELKTKDIVTDSQEPVEIVPVELINTDKIIEEEPIINENVDIDKFYYNQLNEYGKMIYQQLMINKENFKTGNYTVDFGAMFNSLLHQENGQEVLSLAFETSTTAFIYDNVDMFYIDLSKMRFEILATTSRDITTYTTLLRCEENENYLSNGFNTLEDVNNAIIETERVKNVIINSVKDMSDYEKVKQVHNILINSLSYDITQSEKNIHNIYGGLVIQKAVCDGYAKSLKYILDDLDIPCILITGVATNTTGETENHAWNYVQLEDKWYGIDITWDDPLIDGENSGYAPEKYKYDYFLKGQQVFEESYRITETLGDPNRPISYPELIQ